MKTKMTFISLLIFLFALMPNAYAENKMPPNEAKEFVKNAVMYALETRDPNMDYGKYVANNFTIHIDLVTFNFDQWVKHLKDIKATVKSMKPNFELLVAENDTVAAIYTIHWVKNDNSELDVKDLAFFKIKNHKIMLVEELTHLIQGKAGDQNIGSMK